MNTLSSRWFAIAVSGMVFAGYGQGIADTPNADPSNAFEQDRKAILSMAGDFRVTFQFDETVTLVPESEPSKRHVSRAVETVRVLEDRGDFISLQHILLDGDDDKQTVVKHWRQDWQYEDASIHVFRGHDQWDAVTTDPAETAGTWSQTVFQVDDSPRYSSIGKWVHIAGHSYWESGETWRPLPRRELKERDDYDILVGRNRHSITPEGWLHEQDNYKLALRDGGSRILARETGFNTYDRIADYDVSAADEYWSKTEAFWATVRKEWNELLADNLTFRIAEEVDGKNLIARMMGLAKDHADGDEAARSSLRKSVHGELARYTTEAVTP